LSKTVEVWRTDEQPPRRLDVLGISAIDPDCLVALLEGSDKPLWIVEHSGAVCGLGDGVYAHRVFE